jgi:hypothetical protein
MRAALLLAGTALIIALSTRWRARNKAVIRSIPGARITAAPGAAAGQTVISRLGSSAN